MSKRDPDLLGEPTTNLGFALRGALRPAPVTDPGVLNELIHGTRQLAAPFLSNTDFWIGELDTSVLTDGYVFTVWRRDDKGGVPYSITELAEDLERGQVDRRSISQEVESAIWHFASVDCVPATPMPVVIEDCTGRHMLVLEGNRRLSGLVLGRKASQRAIQVYAGHTWLPWWAMLSRLGLRHNAG